MAAENPKLTPEQVVTDIRRRVGYFKENPNLRPGDADSKHGVLFGELSSLGPVAVKPFGDFGRARGERDHLKRVAEAGFEALEPLAVAKGGLATYLITRRRNGLRNLGQNNWDVNVASRHLKGIVVPTLATVASTFADWNNAGIFHGDGQPKNLVYDKRTGNPVFADAERTQFNPSGNKSVLLGDRDLSLFGINALSRGLLDDRSAKYRAGFLNAHLLEPYMDAVTYPTYGVTPEERQEIIQGQWVRSIKRDWQPHWANGDSQLQIPSPSRHSSIGR